MDKTAYLDAMNIVRWRSADKPGKAYLVLHDLDADLSAQQFISDVLGQFNITPEQCEFDCDMVKGTQVVWDMRKLRMRPRVAWIVSSPLEKVLNSSEEKRQIWQQICDKKQKLASQGTA